VTPACWLLTIENVKTWDAAIIGGGIIGLSLALEFRKHRLTVAVIDKTEPGREASAAAGGMIAHSDPHTSEQIIDAAMASAELYPEYVHEIEDESGEDIDLRSQGTISFSPANTNFPCPGPRPISIDELAKLEPNVSRREDGWYLPEISVDVRALMQGLVKACKHRAVHFAVGAAAVEAVIGKNRVTAVRTEKSLHAAGVVVNCAGAWAGEIAPLRFPVKPVKGHMLSLVSHQAVAGIEPTREEKPLVQHVIRNPGIVYVVPRTDGRHIVGSTLEDAGFDKRVDPDVIQRLHQAAANLVPELGEARMLEAWTGLRPTSPDKLPLLGETSIRGYFAATGHYRDGIMLAPITAKIMSELVRGETPSVDLSLFSPERFSEVR